MGSEDPLSLVLGGEAVAAAYIVRVLSSIAGQRNARLLCTVLCSYVANLQVKYRPLRYYRRIRSWYIPSEVFYSLWLSATAKTCLVGHVDKSGLKHERL